MLKWIKDVILYFNQSGVPVPLARDNKSPSVSLTLLIISSIFVMLGLLSLTVPWLQVSFWESLSWFVTCAVLYLNRGAKISKDGVEITSSKDDDEQKGLDT